jgi:histidinol-phosphate aminotransferase
MNATAKTISEKGGGTFKGVRLLLCENPLPPLDEAIEAANKVLPFSNFYTEAYSAPLRKTIARIIGIPEVHIHINAGSELILRQLFARLGQQVHLLTPTYALFPEIATRYTETRLLPENDFKLNLTEIQIPKETTLFVIVNPNNPNGTIYNMDSLPELLRKHPNTYFLVDEAFIGVAGQPVAHLVPEYDNLIVTRTFSKAHSLAGFRVGYAVLPKTLANEMNNGNDAYPLARVSEAAAIATLHHEDKIALRIAELKTWTKELSANMKNLGVRTYPTSTYFFLADFAPIKAETVAKELAKKGFLLKALNDKVLGDGFMRITTSTPDNNILFIQALEELLHELK